MSQSGQVISTGKPGRAGTHHHHRFVAARLTQQSRPGPAVIGRGPFQSPYIHGTVQIGQVAGTLAGMIANPPAHTGKRTLFQKSRQGQVKVTPGSGPCRAGYIVSCRAGSPAGRGFFHKVGT